MIRPSAAVLLAKPPATTPVVRPYSAVAVIDVSERLLADAVVDDRPVDADLAREAAGDHDGREVVLGRRGHVDVAIRLHDGEVVDVRGRQVLAEDAVEEAAEALLGRRRD